MTSEVSVGRMYSSPLRTNELLDEAVVISNSPFLSSQLKKNKRGRGEKDSSPKASHVNFSHPDVAVEVVAIEIVLQDQAKRPNHGCATPGGIATHSRCSDPE
jgi:hypothetical protein